MDIPHAPARLHAHGCIADRSPTPLRIDRIERRHQPLRALPVVPVKAMGLYLMGWYQLGLWECLGDKALDGAVTTACAYPARDTGPCDPAHHHEHRPRNPAALAEGGRGQRGWEA